MLSAMSPVTLSFRAIFASLAAFPGLALLAAGSLYLGPRAGLVVALLGASIASVPQWVSLRGTSLAPRGWPLTMMLGWLVWVLGIGVVAMPLVGHLTNPGALAQLSLVGLPALFVGGLANAAVQAWRVSRSSLVRRAFFRSTAIGYFSAGSVTLVGVRLEEPWAALAIAAAILGAAFGVASTQAERAHASIQLAPTQPALPAESVSAPLP